MRHLNSRNVGWIGGGVLMVLAGCSGNTPRPPASSLQEGLTILDAKDPSWGMNAAYVKQGRAVYVETRVGSLKPDVYRQSFPDDPAYEMDVRFVDQDGHTFSVSRGGDNFADPTWAAELRASHLAKHDPALRELDFKLAKEAAQLVGTSLPASFKDHAFHMTQHATQPVPSENPLMIAEAARIAKNPPPAAAASAAQETGYGSFNSGGWSTFWAGEYQVTLACAFWVCGYHSGADIWSCDWNGSGCNWADRFYANNHGRAQSQMNFSCATQGGWQYNGISGSTAGNNTGAWDGQGGCQTAYSWSAGGYNHLCNDDTAFEMAQAKWGPQDNINFTYTGGSNKGTAYYGCAEQNNNGGKNTWGYPNCF